MVYKDCCGNETGEKFCQPLDTLISGNLPVFSVFLSSIRKFYGQKHCHWSLDMCA